MTSPDGLLVQAGATTLDMAAPLAARLKPFGWHIQFNMPAEHMREAEEVLAKLPVRIVFDHMAHIPQPAGPSDPSFAALRRLLDKGNTWVKLSGTYLDGKQGGPGYPDTSRVARELARVAPERVVWASSGSPFGVLGNGDAVWVRVGGFGRAG